MNKNSIIDELDLSVKEKSIQQYRDLIEYVESEFYKGFGIDNRYETNSINKRADVLLKRIRP